MKTHQRGAFGVGALVCLIASATPNTSKAEQPQGLVAYEAGSIQDQLELDITPIPVGMGALFVPSLTNSKVEPKVVVFHEGERVASGSTGKRIVLPPGQYTVAVAQGDSLGRAEATIEVIDGVTSPVTDFFGGVRVEAVDRDGRPIEEAYLLKSLDGKLIYGKGRSSGSTSYSDTQTWLLPPGDYVLVLGAHAERETERFAFSLHADEVLRYRMVVDDDRLASVDFAKEQIEFAPSIWKFSWVIGADLGLERTSQQLSTFNGQSLRLGAQTDANVGLDTGRHLAALNVGLDESWLSFEPEHGRGLEMQKLSDELSVELLYNYRLGGILGPYVRATGRTSFFDTTFVAGQDTRLEIESTNGDVATQDVAMGESTVLLEGFSPLVTQQGAGVGLTLLNNDHVTFFARAGVAAWQANYNGGVMITDSDASQSTLALARLDDKRLFGMEGTSGLKLKLGQVFSYTTTIDAFIPQDQVFMQADFSPGMRWNNTVALQLGRFAALVYDASVHRDDPQIQDYQFRQNLSVRLQHTLF